MPKREKAGGETTFQNPLDGEDAATNFDDERDAPAAGIDVQKATFDDDEAPSGAPQGNGTQSMSPRTQARVNAHYVQKFVGDNLFGEATLDDLDDDPNLEQHKTKCLGLLHPRTSASAVYDFVQMIALWYIVILVPWRIAFELRPSYPEAQFFSDLIVDLAIVFDIILNTRRYYFDTVSHKLVTEPAEIRRAYLRSWFTIDVLSIIPFEQVLELIFSGSDTAPASGTRMIRMARLARFARLIRLSKLANMRKFFKMVNNTLHNIGVSQPGMEFAGRLVFLAGVVLFITHVIACLWINVGRELTKLGHGYLIMSDRPMASTLSADCLEVDSGDCEIVADSVPAYNNWYAMEYGISNSSEFALIPNYDDESDARWKVYMDSCYWILTTMSTVGFGDITPYNTYERVFTCFTILTGAFLWAYIVGSFSSSLANIDRDKARYEEEMRKIKAMLRFHEVPLELADRVDAFFEYKYETHTMFDDNEILDGLPARIRSDLILHRFRNIIEMIPFFRGCREDAVIEIVSRMKSFSVLPRDYLFHKGDPYVELCVLTKGRMCMVTELENGEDRMDAEYFPGAFFGETEFLGFGRERQYTVRSRTFCEVSTLHPEDMEPVLRIHVKLRRRLERYAKLKTEIEKSLVDMQGDASDNSVLEKLKAEIEEGWEDEEKELRDAFDKIDKDGKGTVGRDRIGDLAKEMGRPMEEWELDVAMNHMDADGNGTVDYDEFAVWWEKNDARLKFTGRTGDNHQNTVEKRTEALLEMTHTVLERLEKLEAKVDGLAK